VFRSLAVVPVLVLFLVATAAAPVPKEKAQPNYFPTTLGSKWVYKTGDGTSSMEVTAVETNGDTRFVTVAFRVNDKPTTTERMVISGKGVFRERRNNEPFEPPICVLRYPYKPGEKWDVNRQTEKTTFTAHEAEEIEVPTGRFKAIRVEVVAPPAILELRETHWFVPGVGPVKSRYSTKGSETLLQELKSFTPGKE
jgi:hypothetical protein